MRSVCSPTDAQPYLWPRPLTTATSLLPARDKALDVPALGLGEGEVVEQAPGLVGIVVRDRGLEMLAERSRLPQLATEPAEETDGCLIDHPWQATPQWTFASR